MIAHSVAMAGLVTDWATTQMKRGTTRGSEKIFRKEIRPLH